MNSRVSIVRAKSYDTQEVLTAVRRAVDLLGGMPDYVKKGERILLKPNALSAKPPESGINTHPEVLRAAARLVREAGAEVVVGDSPGGFGFERAGSTYGASGIKKVCEEEKLELVDFKRVHNIGGIPIASYAREVDAIISIPKMKTHSLTVITGAVKNSYGLAVGTYKTICHLKAPKAKDFARYVVDVFECAVPRLVIMDGVVAMEGDGPASGGTLRNAGLILASNDCVACDTVFAHLIGFPPLRVDVINEAYRRKLGEAELSRIKILGEDIKSAGLRGFRLPGTALYSRIPRPVFKLLARGIRFWPEIDDAACNKCRLCVKSCPAACISVNEEGSKIDYKKCIACFCCFELCPHNAVSIKRSLLAKLLG